MRILHITAQKPDSTGSGVYLAETVRGFEALGHRVAVVCGVDASDEPFVSPTCELFPVRFNTPELPFDVVGMSDVMPYPATRYRDLTPEMTERFKVAFSAAIERAVDAMCAAGHAPDLVLCHHLYLVTALAVREVARLRAERGLRCPVAALCHNTDLRQMRSHGLEREYIRTGIGRLDAVLALHDGQRADIAQVYGVDPGRVRVVGTGYNDQVFYPDVQARGEGDPLRVVYAGKIARAKGVESLLACLGRLPEVALAEKISGAGGAGDASRRVDGAALWSGGAPALELRLAGGYSSAAEYDRACELAAAAPAWARVSFEGRLSQPELARLYNRSDVFVLPSFCEGLPLVVVEALACGCAVAVTDLPGIRPWIEEQMPGAPVVYVAPPRMVSSDEPLPGDLPAFEARLAEALLRAAALPRSTCDEARARTAHLSWGALSARILEACRG